MEIEYKTRKMQKTCTNHSEAKKQYGKEMAEKIAQRISEIKASESVDMMIRFGIGRCHSLTGDRKGQYAVDLVHPYRLVFKIRQGTAYDTAVINDVVDYH